MQDVVTVAIIRISLLFIIPLSVITAIVMELFNGIIALWNGVVMGDLDEELLQGFNE